MNVPRASARSVPNGWRISDLTPDVARALRLIAVLAIVGGAVLITGTIMGKAQAPARRLIGG